MSIRLEEGTEAISTEVLTYTEASKPSKKGQHTFTIHMAVCKMESFLNTCMYMYMYMYMYKDMQVAQ